MKTNRILMIVIIFFVLTGVYCVSNQSQIKTKESEGLVKNILSRMTLQDKIGQMVLIDKNAITPEEVSRNSIGGVLSGGGGNPKINTPEEWYKMVEEFQIAAMNSKLKIPAFYGVDAVHGHGNVKGAVIFPHAIGLGATRDQMLVESVGRATAEEVRATGANWNFAPVLSLPNDLRWGRVYECFSTDVDLVAELGTSYIKGLQSRQILSTPKHYIGEGAEDWGTSKEYNLDQGDITIGYSELTKAYLLPFEEAIKAGSMSIMVSRSSLNGKKISGNKYLLTDLLKNQLGFEGFLVSDWGAIDQLSGDHYQNTVDAINAGMDMIMLPGDHSYFMNNVASAVNNGEIPVLRIDDAVTRILEAKKSIGLLGKPLPDKSLLRSVGSQEHREIARRAVRQSLVLLKNDNKTLPINTPKNILIVGRAADDIGMQAGGWTIEWQGGHGDSTLGVSILNAFKKEFIGSEIIYDPKAEKTLFSKADVGIAVVGERPYAEGVGDRERLSMSAEDLQRIKYAKNNSRRVVVIIIAGRPLIIQEAMKDVDVVIMAWLPGTEGAGITDVLSGKYNFSGKLPLAWPKTMEQVENKDTRDPLFEFGYGLTYDN